MVRVMGVEWAVGPAVSWACTVAVDAVQFDPTVNAIVDVRVAVPVKVRLDGLKAAETHWGRLPADSVMVPLNPLMLVALTVICPDRPAAIVVEDGDAETEKSVTCTGIVIVWVRTEV